MSYYNLFIYSFYFLLTCFFSSAHVEALSRGARPRPPLRLVVPTTAPIASPKHRRSPSHRRAQPCQPTCVGPVHGPGQRHAHLFGVMHLSLNLGEMRDFFVTTKKRRLSESCWSKKIDHLLWYNSLMVILGNGWKCSYVPHQLKNSSLIDCRHVMTHMSFFRHLLVD